jgi:putative transposase
VASALAYRWDNKAHELYFEVKAGSYNSGSLIEWLEGLREEMGRRKVILIWDGLPAHKSGQMKSYVERQKSWLEEERLPGYAPEINAVEQLWGNVKRTELANLCAKDLREVSRELKAGMKRVRRKALAKSFLAHAGLFL